MSAALLVYEAPLRVGRSLLHTNDKRLSREQCELCARNSHGEIDVIRLGPNPSYVQRAASDGMLFKRLSTPGSDTSAAHADGAEDRWWMLPDARVQRLTRGQREVARAGDLLWLGSKPVTHEPEYSFRLDVSTGSGRATGGASLADECFASAGEDRPPAVPLQPHSRPTAKIARDAAATTRRCPRRSGQPLALDGRGQEPSQLLKLFEMASPSKNSCAAAQGGQLARDGSRRSRRRRRSRSRISCCCCSISTAALQLLM